MVSENISLHDIGSTWGKAKGSYTAINHEEEDEPASEYESGSSRIVPPQTAGSTLDVLCTLVTRVGLVLVLVILLAIYGQRASRIDAIQSVSGADGTIDVAVAGDSHLPLLRPCQILKSYDGTPTSDKDSRPQVLQTSLSQPSAQWSEISCFESFDTGSSWELIGSFFRGGSNDGASIFNKPDVQKEEGRQNERKLNAADRSFQLPSAIIQADFSATQSKKRPPILGFGGAFTEASALNYNRLSEAGKRAYTELMFGVSGLGYSIGRVHMNSCDFSVKSYSFDTVDGDFNLTHFDMGVTHDVESGMVGMILDAKAVAEKRDPSNNINSKNFDGKLLMYASPWSPPAWMKKPTYDDPPGAEHAVHMTGSTTPNCLRDGTGAKSKYAEAWALYFSKFISAYKNQSIDFWGVTVQNEPEFPAPWEACAYDKYTQGEFVQYHLGPTLERDHPDVKLFVFDHNKDHAPAWATYLMNSTNPASNYIDGTAYHWYAGGMDRLLDGAVGSANMHRLMSDLSEQNADSEHVVFGSEACHCPSTGYAGGDLKVGWARAERYAHTILADLAAGSNAWVEWNLLLDERGGPNHLGNLCDAPVLAVPQRSRDFPEGFREELEPLEPKPMRRFDPIVGDARTRAELHAMGNPAKYLDVGLVVQPMYYYIGHITRHVRPGTRPVTALVDSSADGADSRTFRPAGQEVPGGGLNDLARTGIEATLWPCEGSTRQSWILNSDGQLQVEGHDWKDNPTSSCLKKSMDRDFFGIVLGDCNVTLAASFEVSPIQPLNNSTVELVLTNGKTDSDESLCLNVKPLLNGGGSYGPRGGAQLKYGACGVSAAHWKYSAATGELISSYFQEDGGDVCLTTGWPFLQAGAFDNKVVVVLNEANDAANFLVKDGDLIVLATSIPAHSIQTLLL